MFLRTGGWFLQFSALGLFRSQLSCPIPLFPTVIPTPLLFGLLSENSSSTIGSYMPNMWISPGICGYWTTFIVLHENVVVRNTYILSQIYKTMTISREIW